MGRKRQLLANNSGPKEKIRKTDENKNDSEKLQQSQSQQLQILAKRSGKINKIVLINFMCHKNLAVEFNPNVTILVGNNGSGKSAILTAMIVGLGSSSHVTSRCTNITQLIKHGETSGSVEIHISNDCSEAFEPETYGHEIIVQRTFSRSGSSTYRIKTASGKIVSTSRKHLMKILLFLNVQVENPVCVLNQDASRAFLKESNPKKRFELFLKASRIDCIMQLLDNCATYYNEAKNHLNNKNAIVAELKVELDKIQNTFKALKSIGYLKETLHTYKLELAWLKVQNEENLHNEMLNTINKYKDIFENIMKSLNEKDCIESERQAICDGLQKEIDRLKSEMHTEVQKRDILRANISNNQEDIQNTNRECKKIAMKIEHITRNINLIEKEISESEESQIAAIAREKLANEKKLAKLQENKAEYELAKTSLLRDIEMFRDTRNVYEKNLADLQEKRGRLVSSKEKLSQYMRQCDNNKSSLSKYGEFMPEFVKAMKELHRKGQLKHMPRGPLGESVKVSDSKWKPIVEKLIGKSKLMAFCVNSDGQDIRVLNQLISSRFPQAKQCPLLSVKFDVLTNVYNLSKGLVSAIPKTKCALDIIKVNDPIILNVLIDTLKLEKILFTEDYNTAFNLITEDENVPQNLKKLILLDPPTEVFPSPVSAFYTINAKPAIFIQVRLEERKLQLRNEITKLDEQLNEVQANFSLQQKKLSDVNNTIKNKDKTSADVIDKLRAITQAINQLERMEYPGQREREYLEKELEELKKTRNNHENELEATKTKINQMMSDIEIQRKEYNKEVEKMKDREEEINEKQLKIYAENDKAAKFNANLKFEQEKAKKLEINLNKVEKEEQDCQRKILALTATASKIGRRIPINNTDEFLSTNIKKTELKIKTVSDASEPIEVVEKLLTDKTGEYNKENEFIESLKDTLKALNESRKKRYIFLHRLKTHISTRVQQMFHRILDLRNFDGSISVDYQNKVLDLSVIPRDKNIENAVSSANCLSGGERSYSTIAFLLALWSVADSPFYFLDEYDVYTDKVNRYFITQLLLSEARKKPNRQYLFLTPQDMSDITPSETVSIQRLADPR